jgi:hypothetical protein
MSPFKISYGQEIEKWFKHHGNRIMMPYQIGQLVDNVYLQSSTVQVAVNGFLKTGLYPCNRNIVQWLQIRRRCHCSSEHQQRLSIFTAPSDISPIPHLHKCSP